LFSVNQHKFPGVAINARLTRYYPFAELTTHVLGYVAKINRRDLVKLAIEDKEQDYAATHDIGKLGLEKYYEELLHGHVGHQEVEVNSQGRIIRTLSMQPPTPGKNLHLSLDIELQMVAKRALAGKRGAVVAMNPRDGSILAMYSNPSYDGNAFVHGISSKSYKKLLRDKRLPLINRTLQGYPPASTIKPFISIIGLENKVITPHTRIWDPGWYQLKGVESKSRDWKPGGHGWVNLNKAIEQSCNVYFFDLAYRLGIEQITQGMEKFGFGDYTNIDLSEESKGILPSVEYKRQRFNRPWYTGETLSVGIGQSYWSVTPLQLANALSILVNKGSVKIPHLLAATSEKTAQNDEQFTPQHYEEKAPIILKQSSHWDDVLRAMHHTVQKPGATGYDAFKGTHYDAAGKTGSAQVTSVQLGLKFDASKIKESKRPNALFIAFAPFENPEIVVAVAIENVSHGGGGSNAGPVARQVMDQYFGNRTITTHLR
jgi:penicillin-binding protein 2